MSITRLETYPGLSSGANFAEHAYSTDVEAWPVARLRLTPELADDGVRVHQPNAPTLPQRVAVRISASLVDEAGQVMRIGGRLLVGPESVHGYQFDAGEFDPVAWLDGRAAVVIAPLLRQAAGMAAADAAGLLPPLPDPE